MPLIIGRRANYLPTPVKETPTSRNLGSSLIPVYRLPANPYFRGGMVQVDLGRSPVAERPLPVVVYQIRQSNWRGGLAVSWQLKRQEDAPAERVWPSIVHAPLPPGWISGKVILWRPVKQAETPVEKTWGTVVYFSPRSPQTTGKSILWQPLRLPVTERTFPPAVFKPPWKPKPEGKTVSWPVLRPIPSVARARPVLLFRPSVRDRSIRGQIQFILVRREASIPPPVPDALPGQRALLMDSTVYAVLPDSTVAVVIPENEP